MIIQTYDGTRSKNETNGKSGEDNVIYDILCSLNHISEYHYFGFGVFLGILLGWESEDLKEKSNHSDVVQHTNKTYASHKKNERCFVYLELLQWGVY